jgi:AbrB family looped-hinge helix DNA binding protein
MTSTVDTSGRVEIPLHVRDAVGLKPGSTVDIVVRDGVVVLVPTTTPMRLVQRGGGVVAEPEQPLPTLTAEDVRLALEAGRR